MKKVAILAAGGKAGQLIVKEALERHLEVSAFVRPTSKASFEPSVKVIKKDIFDLQVKDLQGFDIIISAFGEWVKLELHLKAIQHLSKILQNNSAKFLIVGGAGSLYMDSSHKLTLSQTPDFPKEYKPLADAQGEVLNFLRTQNAINWVFVSPPAVFVPDEPKGAYKIIGEEFQVNDKGESKASYASYASAMIDIALDSQYKSQRVGVIGL